MPDPTPVTGATDILLGLGPGGAVAVLGIAFGVWRDRVASAAQDARDKLADRYVADVAKLAEALALSREQSARTESALRESAAVLEQSGPHRIIP